MPRHDGAPIADFCLLRLKAPDCLGTLLRLTFAHTPENPIEWSQTRVCPMTNRNSVIAVLAGQTDSRTLDRDLARLHLDSVDSVSNGRNVTAGYARGWGLEYGRLGETIAKDPVFRDSLQMARPRSLVLEQKLMNLFLIMKYGIRDHEVDFIEFGSYRGGSAIFIANVARQLGLRGTVYALDTFEGMPPTNDEFDLHSAGDFSDANLDDLEKYIKEVGLTNIIPVKGLFSDAAPSVLSRIRSIGIAHIDCDIHDAVKYCLDAVMPKMSSAGGYVVLDDALHGSCLGAMQAVEEWVITNQVHAEQAYPHLVYRYPPVRCHHG